MYTRFNRYIRYTRLFKVTPGRQYLEVTVHNVDLVGVGDGGPGQEQSVPGLLPDGDDDGVGGV